LKWLSFTRVLYALNIDFMLVLENVYQNLTQEAKQEVVNLWRNENALLDDKKIDERLGQTVIIIRDSESGKLVGVSTAEKKKMKALNNNQLYEFRCFIAETYRVAGLDVKLSKQTFEFLETLSKSEGGKTVGIFSVLENESLKKESVWRRAVWPEIEMYFVGYTNSGNPIRVHYFKGARI
jgi:hypothetical protein